MKILVTGGTVFASRFTAKYFVEHGNEVFVLNRGNHPQEKGVNLIECDRHNLGNILKAHHFDAVLDVTAYNEADVKDMIESLGGFDNYIFVSSSAVYPEYLSQPFKEEQLCGHNSFWGDYGTNKIAAENFLLKNVPNAYIIRPPYLYGEMNNLYREAFVFECAENDRNFYVPKDGKMQLQFLNIEDMCRFMEILLSQKPQRRIFNVGNSKTVSIFEWAELCYSVVGKTPQFVFVDGSVNQRSYFPFFDYEYVLDVTEQTKLMPSVKSLTEGLKRSYKWYSNRNNREGYIRTKPLIEYIDRNLRDS